MPSARRSRSTVTRPSRRLRVWARAGDRRLGVRRSGGTGHSESEQGRGRILVGTEDREDMLRDFSTVVGYQGEMGMDISGKVALVTGGAARVGRALALGLAEAGADLVVHYNRSEAAAADTVLAARQYGVRATALQSNLADPRSQDELVRAAQEAYGRVDLLVHSASPFVAGSLEKVTREEWRLVMGVVVEGFLALAQGLAPGMVDRGEGEIVVILDRGIIDPWPDYLAHGVAKSALWALARTLAVELAPHVHVNGIVPGPVLPPPSMSERVARRIAEGTLAGRWGGTQSIVDAMLFLLRSDYVTGERLFVDGGERWAHRRPSRN